MAKLPADEIILARKGHASDPKRDAAIQFARKVIETRGKVSDADVKAVRDAFALAHALPPLRRAAWSERSRTFRRQARAIAGNRYKAFFGLTHDICCRVSGSQGAPAASQNISGFGGNGLMVRRSARLFAKEIDHEPASCTAGSQRRGSRGLFSPGPRNHASVVLHSSLKAARDAA